MFDYYCKIMKMQPDSDNSFYSREIFHRHVFAEYSRGTRNIRQFGGVLPRCTL